MSIDNKLKTLLGNITDGNLRQLIGPGICNSIVQYNHMLEIDSNIEYTDILINRFGKDILINLNNNVLEQIIWALDKDQTKSLMESFSDLNREDEDGFKRAIIDSLPGKFRPNNNFSVKLLTALKLNPETYLFEKKEDLIIKREQTPKFPPHDFQKHIKDQSIKLLLNTDSPNKHMIHMPTGSGKTKTAMEIICDFIRTKVCLGGYNSSVKILWFAHSAELCEQAFESFSLTWTLRGDRDINSIKFFGKYDLTKQYIENTDTIIFAGFAKIVSALKGRNESVKRILSKIKESIDLVVVDEAHRSMAEEWNKAINYFSGNPGAQMIGLTATPGRSVSEDTRLLSYFFDSKKVCLVDSQYRLLEKPVEYLQKREFLAKIERREVLTNYDLIISQEEFQNIKKFGDTKKLKNILIDLSRSPVRNKIIIKEIQKQYELNNKLLVFACSIEHCIIIQSLLTMANIKSEVIISDTSAAQRTSAINSFKNGDLKILINFGVLTTGFDAPNINSLLIARPVFSIVLYSQMIGRALRGPKNRGNKENIVLTLKDNIKLGEVNDLFNSFNELWK